MFKELSARQMNRISRRFALNVHSNLFHRSLTIFASIISTSTLLDQFCIVDSYLLFELYLFIRQREIFDTLSCAYVRNSLYIDGNSSVVSRYERITLYDLFVNGVLSVLAGLQSVLLLHVVE